MNKQKIKVLYLPLNNYEIQQNGMVNGFLRANVDLQVFDFNTMSLDKINKKKINENLIDIASKFKPDLIHMQLQFTTVIPVDTLLKIKKILPNIIISNWTGDIRTTVPQTYINTADAVDYNLISSVGQLDMYEKAIGKKAHYFQIGYDPTLYCPQNKKNNFKWDAVFTANCRAISAFPGEDKRREVAKLLRDQLGDRFGLFGSGWEKNSIKSQGYLNRKHTNATCNDSLCVISISNFNTTMHYFSGRLLNSMASGRPVISLNFPGWDSYFTNGVDIIIADSTKDIVEKVKILLSDTDLANRIGQAGAKKVQTEHTWYSRVLDLLHLVQLR